MWLRNYIQWLVKIAFFIHIAYFAVSLLFNYDKSFNKQALFIMHLGSLTASLLIGWLASKFKLALIDYVVMIVVGVRCIEIFIVLHLIEAKTPGFETTDKKDLADSLLFIA